MSYSKGKWDFELYSSHDDIVITVDGWDIANMVNPSVYPVGEDYDPNDRTSAPDLDMQLANARLMTSAPKLLEACENALADLQGIVPILDAFHPAAITITELEEAIKLAREGE